jgi:hypothetical protein
MNQEVSDLLELAGLGDVEDIVAAIMQVVAGSADGTEGRVAGDNSGKRDRFFRRGL